MSSDAVERFLCCVALLSFCSTVCLAQNTEAKDPPVIDVHVHAMDANFPGLAPMCPNTSKFTASDPKEKEEPFGWVKEPCTPALYPAAPGEYMKDVLAEMERLNVTAVVFGDPKSVKKWKDAGAGRIIPGTSFQDVAPGQRVALDELRKDFTGGGFKVMGEIGLQYEGISPSDSSVDAYFALAEELDVPVAIHMGTGGSGRANITTPKFRGSMGNPLLLEELLARHPKLRVQVMHAGYPMIDNMLTLLQANSHVYVDVAGLIWRNSHDLDAIMSHYAPEVVLTSPVAARFLNDPSGAVRGQLALCDYFKRGLEVYPNLTFELLDVMWGLSSVVLYYRNQNGTTSGEFMELDANLKVVRVVANYGG
jgi:Tat protein secretion system quality control protein TatD with DNase activity